MAHCATGFLCRGWFPNKMNDSPQLPGSAYLCLWPWKAQLRSRSQALATGGGMLHLWPSLRQVWVKRMASFSPPPSFKWSNTTHVEGPWLGASILPHGFVSSKKSRSRECRHSESAIETSGCVPLHNNIELKILYYCFTHKVPFLKGYITELNIFLQIF